MKVILKKAINVGKVLKSENDKIHFGDKIQQERKNYYIIKNPIFYKNNLFVLQKNEKKNFKSFIYFCLNYSKISIANIKAPFPIRRRQLLKLKLIDLLQIKKLKTFDLKKNSYLFVMHKPHSNNYWHSLIDNFSDLINILLNFKNIDILCNFDDFSELNKKYFFFLKQIFNFNYINIKNKNLLLNGNVLMTDTGVQHGLGLEFNKELAEKINIKAFDEAKENFQADKIEPIYKIDKYGYNYGIVPHSYKLFYERKERVVKNYIIPFTTPYRFSIFSAFKFLKTKINLSEKNYKRIFIIRKKEKKIKSFKNFEEIKKILTQYDFSFISFEDYSFIDQIKIMHSCKILLGLHGAGFTNMVFMQPGCSVIDILPFYYSIPRTKEFQISAEMIGLNYFEIYTKKDINAHTKFEIEPNKLIGVIKNALNN
ncbi:glycosyltransferase family 61 protein [Alphaproteobacteria bacterium]|nr:glycosyltransferase family 61 protein [Alphaproteobacteria bacterium]